MKMDVKNKIAKAKIQLIMDNPFFGYLSLYLKPKALNIFPTIGVNPEGTLYFNPEWIKKLSINHLKAVIAHEVMHLALMHPLRQGNRNQMAWNIACDLAVNWILIRNNFELPAGSVAPDYHGQWHGIDVKDKTAEEIYRELLRMARANSGKGSGGVGGKTLDDHSKWSEGLANGKKRKVTQAELKKMERRIKKRIAEAYNYAKRKGKLPAGIERLVEELLYPKLPWRAILWRFIQSNIAVDYTYLRPSKKSIAAGVYLPSVKKENLDIMVAIDTSGSISEKELAEFLSELYAIAKSFESTRIHVVTCDAAIQDKFILTERNAGKLKEIKVHGGGGTDFRPVFEYAKKINARALVYFTDGYGYFPEREEVKTLWVISKDGTTEVPFGQVVKLG